MQPLNRIEFAAALKKGLGRGWLHVANYGLDNVADLVLEACLHNQNYDPQCNSSRAAWLFEMFGKTPHHPKFQEAILSALKTENNSWDVAQLCGLAKEMAAHGDQKARLVLKNYAFDKASRRDDDDGLGADEWVELTGMEGVIELARIYGQRLMIDPNDRPSDYLGWTNETEPIYRAVLIQHAQADPAIAVYCKYLEAQGAFTPRQPVDRERIRQETRQRFRGKYPLSRILDEAKKGTGEFPGHYSSFGRYATEEELEEVYSMLLATTDDVSRVRLLWVFRRAQLPQLADVIFLWATGENEELRRAAIAALAQNTNTRVHTLAKAKVTAGDLNGADSEALDLFLRNYQSEDAQLIATALAMSTPATDWEAHDLSWSLIDLAKQYDDPNLAATLRWAYENTPCTNCRYEIVKLLDKFQSLDEALLQECLHDAEEDTRAVARERLEQRK